MKNVSNSFARLFGVLLCFAAIWLGPYIIHNMPTDHWIRFPVFLSSVLVFGGGLVMAIFGSEA